MNKYYCSVCDYTSSSPYGLDRHFKSERHSTNMQEPLMQNRDISNIGNAIGLGIRN